MSPPPPPPDRPDFRPDLEGLRGVAILLVVLFHAGVTAVGGGFVGVDVFYVLSGFFITGLILREIAAPESADLSRFYARRSLRLIPPLLVVLLATMLLVAWLWAPIDRAPIYAAGRAAALSSSNVHFAQESVDYFSRGENPLLHTWSLAVEEQFYLLWPLLLVLFALGADRWRATDGGTSRGTSRGMLGGIVFVGILSLIGALWATESAQGWAFYSMPTRLWEFAAGGAIAVMTSWRTSARAGQVLQVLGLAALGIAVAAYDRSTPYPGFAALLPALGTVAIVAGGRDAPDGVPSRVLGAPPLRWIGRMSYAWYLWHWPLVGLGAVLQPRIGVAGKLAWSAVALALAWVTYWLVEYRTRDERLARFSPMTITLATFGASVLVALLAAGAARTARRSAAGPEQRAFAAAREDRMAHACWASGARWPTDPCVFGDPTSTTTVALVGDSHAEHWLGALDRAGRERGWRIVAMVMGGCPVADQLALATGRHADRSRDCARFNEERIERVIAARPAAVILSSYDHYVRTDRTPNYGVSPDAWRRGLRRTYERLSSARIPTVALRDTPNLTFDAPGCLSRRAAGLPFAADCTYALDEAFHPTAVAAQTAAARGLRMRVVDMNDRICDTPRCPTMRPGVVIFTDDDHLTASFSRTVAPVLGARVAAAVRELGGRLP